MLYDFDLKQVGLAVGVLLLLGHAFALLRESDCRRLLTAFPRSRPFGIALLALAAIWAFLLVRTMDLGEFASLRGLLLGSIAVGAVLSGIYVPDFLAVRALGMLVLLAAEPLLGAAFLRPEASRLLVVLLAYVWIFLGLFWVGMPFLLRDQIHWLLASRGRFLAASWAGIGAGIAIFACALFLW